MNIIGNNPEFLKRIPQAVQNAWPNINLVLNPFEPIPENIPKSHCIGVCDGLDRKQVINLIATTGIPHIVQVSSVEFESELMTSAMMIEKPLTFLDDPISNTLLASFQRNPAEFPDAPNHRFKYSFNSSIEKKAALDSLRTYVSKVPKSKTIINNAVLMADELYTNAVFNAPIKKEGMEVSRTISVHLEERKPPALHCFYNSSRLFVGVEDPYGTLRIPKIIERIKICYDQGVSSSIRMGTGGAGIGSFMVYEASCGYYICIDPGKRTLVAATLPLGVSSRVYEETPKNFHIALRGKGK